MLGTLDSDIRVRREVGGIGKGNIGPLAGVGLVLGVALRI